MMQLFFKRLFLQSQEFSSRSSEFISDLAKLIKLGDLSEIIYQKLLIFDKNFFIKAQKNPIIFIVFGTEGIRLQDLKQNSVIRVQVLLAESI